MLREIGKCTVILIVATGAAVAVNQFRAQPLTWIRRDLTPTHTPPPGPVPSPEPIPSPVPPPVPVKETVATINDVLSALQSGSAYLVDAREAHEYDESHLRGAVNLPSSAIYQNIDRVRSVVPADAKVIVYCGGGQCEASDNVSDALRRDFGYENVVIYTKGWDEVSASGRFGEFIVSGDQP